MKKEKYDVVIMVLFGFLFALVAVFIGIIILWSKSPTVEKQIIKEIEEDQEAQNKVVLLYSTPIKMNENTNFYMFGDEEEWIAYEIKVEKGKITWCEEIENESIIILH